MQFDDEPLIPGEALPVLPGHSSPGRLERLLRAGVFAVTAEIAPPDSADPNEVYEKAALFDGYVDAINATDGSGAHCHMSSVGMCSLLTRRGYAMVMQVSARDRNRIAIQGDVLGASAMGVSNILCLTGDSVQVGDHPEAKPVFDVDSLSMLEMLRIMRDEQQAAALIHHELNHHRGDTPVWLIPSERITLVQQMYAWGARNCEIHFAQVRGHWSCPQGIVMPTFMPETG